MTVRTGVTGSIGGGGASNRVGRLVDEELGSTSRYEYPLIERNSQAAEFGPSDDVFERQAAGPAIHHGTEFVWRSRLCDKQPRFFLGENAAGSPKPGDDVGWAKRTMTWHAPFWMPTGALSSISRVRSTAEPRRENARPELAEMRLTSSVASLVETLTLITADRPCDTRVG